MATLTFNLAVLTVLTIGIIMVMKAAVNLVMLAGTFGILAYKKDNLQFYLKDINKIMPANIAHMFHSRAAKGVLLFTTEESRDVIDWIEEKFSHQNRYTNYFTGTVLMIGLLGTFSGLLIAIDDMGRIILSLSGDIDLAKVISDFSGPLGGMAVGFGSSLFGVIAAIILGLKGYILNKNQEMFVEGVEDWLKGRIIDAGGTTTNSVSAPSSNNDLPDHKASFMDVFIDNIASLTKEMSNISKSNERLTSITVASVQQARDEHEQSIDIFEDINKSLQNIDLNAKNTTQVLKQQFNALQISMNTNHEQLINQQRESMMLMIDKVESSLELTQMKITNKFEEIASTSSQEIEDVSTNIAQLLSKINSELEAKQITLNNMQTSYQSNQEVNKDLLNQLITLFRESSSKLDNEFNLLNDISKNIENSNTHANTNFESINKLVKTFSKTLQDELVTLDEMKSLQENQTQIIKNSVEKSQSIYETLLVAQEHNIKNNEELTNITSRMESIKDEFVDINTHNLEKNQKNLEALNLKIDDVILSNQSKPISSKKDGGFFDNLFK
jgi:hypothetical protein